jgi:archaellum biogenesis protein FlaJ (TadC family)
MTKKEFFNYLKGQNIISATQYGFQRTSSILVSTSFFINFILLMTIIFSVNKRGIHDMMGETVIIDG